MTAARTYRFIAALAAAILVLGAPGFVPLPVRPLAVQASACLPPSTDTTGPGDPAPYTVSGRVTDAATAAPVESIVAQVQTTTGQIVGAEFTDADGRWTIGVPAGSYRIGFRTPQTYLSGYLASGSIVVDPDAADLFNVTSASIGGLDVALPAGARSQLAGVVTDSSSNPVADAAINLQGTGVTSTVPCTFTDGDGAYVVANARHGTYRMYVSTNDGPSGWYSATAAGGLVPTRADATTIVHEGETVLDIQLPVATSIAGTVQDAAAAPIAGISVELCVAADPSSCVASSSTDANGAFTLDRVLTGFPYVIKAGGEGNEQYRAGYVGPSGTVVDTIAEADAFVLSAPVSGRIITMTENPLVEGRVIDEGGTGVMDVEVSLCDAAGETGCRYATTDAAGSWAAYVPEGNYRLRLAPIGESRRIAGYLDADGEVSMSVQEAADVAITGDRSGIDVVLPLGYTISGRSAPGVGIDVCLAVDDCVASASADAAGLFTSTAVLPGPYLLASDAGGDRVWYVAYGVTTLDPAQAVPVVVDGDESGVWFDVPTGAATAVGSDVEVAVDTGGATTAPAIISFATVTDPGRTTIVIGEVESPSLPPGFTVDGTVVVFEISTSATFDGSVEVCIPLDGLAVTGTPRLLHMATGSETFIDITSSTPPGYVCGIAESFSPFLVLGRSTGFQSFVGPVDPSPIRNTVKAGASVPVNFDMGGYAGLDIFVAGYPRSVGFACDTDSPTDTLEATTRNASGLTYNEATGLYTYVWKTLKTWAGSCWTLELSFVDGSSATATFEFKR